MSFEENFLYPLMLLGVGTGLTYGLGTILTRKYNEKQKELDLIREDHKQELSIKHDLMDHLSDLIMNLESAIIYMGVVRTQTDSKQTRADEEEESKKMLQKANDDFMTSYGKSFKTGNLLRLYLGDKSLVVKKLGGLIKFGSLAFTYLNNMDHDKVPNMELVDTICELNEKVTIIEVYNLFKNNKNIYDYFIELINKLGFELMSELKQSKLK